MPELVLHYQTDTLSGDCAMCGAAVTLPPGLQLHDAAEQRPVCPRCGRNAAPALTALQGLAGAAERLARMHRHAVCPPMTALLELASAAETFRDRARAAA